MSRILLVEPDLYLARIYERKLRSMGHVVESVAHAQDAICAADACLPDLVVLELQLVGHSGIEFLYEFRSYPEWQGVPVILLTLVPADSLQLDQAAMRLLGVSACLYKPAAKLSHMCRAVDEAVAAINRTGDVA